MSRRVTAGFAKSDTELETMASGMDDGAGRKTATFVRTTSTAGHLRDGRDNPDPSPIVAGNAAGLAEPGWRNAAYTLAGAR